MLLTISSSTPPARDMGFLLHKNPDNVRTVRLAFGDAHVFYPQATDERCTVACRSAAAGAGSSNRASRCGGESEPVDPRL